MKVAMILGKDVKIDPRVLRESSVLCENGYTVFVYVYQEVPAVFEEEWRGICIVQLPYHRRKRALISHLSKLKPDVIVSHDLTTLFYGVLGRLLTGAKFIYDSHELYLHTTQFNSKSLKVRFRRCILAVAERLFISRADAVITVNELIEKELKSKYRLQKDIYTVMNTVSHNIKPLKKMLVDKSYLNLVYQGIFSEGRGLEELCEAMKYTNIRVRLYLYGSGPLEDTIQGIVHDMKLGEKIFLMGYLPYEELLAVSYQFDVGVVCFRPISKNNYLASPNKLFEYISVGLAIVGSNLPFIEKVVNENKMGVIVDPDYVKDIAEKINILETDRELLNRYQVNAMKAYRSRYNWDIEGKTYLGIVDAVRKR